MDAKRKRVLDALTREKEAFGGYTMRPWQGDIGLEATEDGMRESSIGRLWDFFTDGAYGRSIDEKRKKR